MGTNGNTDIDVNMNDNKPSDTSWSTPTWLTK